MLLPPNQESIETLNMVLQIPIATDFFDDYLREVGLNEDENAVYYFSLYVDLVGFDRAASAGVDPALLLQKALQIRSDYLDPEGPYFIDGVRPEVLQPTYDKIQELERALDTNSQVERSQQLNQMLFIELYSYILEKLKVQFERFKRSHMFVELEEEISRQEKLYEILVDASIITN